MKRMTEKHLENTDKYQNLIEKTVFLVKAEDFTTLISVCSGETLRNKDVMEN